MPNYKSILFQYKISKLVSSSFYNTKTLSISVVVCCSLILSLLTMEASSFILHLETIGTSPLIFTSPGNLYVLRKEDVGACKGFSVYAITDKGGKDKNIVPLVLATSDENNPMYVLDIAISGEYIAFVDGCGGTSTSMSSHHARVRQNHSKLTPHVIDLASDEDTPIVDVPSDTPIELDNEQRCEETEDEHSFLQLCLSPNSRSSMVRRMIEGSQTIAKVTELPTSFDGNIVFELPPTKEPVSPMEGMEQALDGHVWTKPTTTNVRLPATVRKSYCVGVLECPMLECGHFLSTRSTNKTAWIGNILHTTFSIGDNNSQIGFL